MKLPFDPVIPLLEIYSKNPETSIQKYICNPMFISVLFTIAKIWKQAECPSMGKWIKNLWYIYTMEYYATVKNEFLLFAAACIELETIMLSEISQLVKGEYHMISPIIGV